MDCSCNVLAMIGKFNVDGAVRIQQYTYILARHEYDDWVQTRHYHYSQKLTRDIRHCMYSGLILKTGPESLPTYSLTRKGKNMLKKLPPGRPDMLKELQVVDTEALLAMA